MDTLNELLLFGTTVLRQAGLPQARHEARLLLEKATRLSRTDMIGRPDQSIPEEKAQAYKALIQQRAEKRQPISRLVGEREFWSLSFVLSPATLDPRPDSETVIEGVLASLACPTEAGGELPQRSSLSPLRLLDLGTGSGCLLLSLLTELPAAHGLGVDLSVEALETARQNAVRLGVADRTYFVQMDWAQGLTGVFDIILSNPPYIPAREVESLAPEVRCHDPLTALTAGPTGLEAYRILAPQIRRLLSPQGICAVEIGQGQHDAVQGLFEAAGLRLLTWREDLSGIKRCGLLTWP